MALRPALYSRILDDRSLTAAAEVAADIGYDGLEVMGREPHLPAETTVETARTLRDHFDELGLAVPCIYTSTGGYVGRPDEERETELDALEPFLELAAVLDCPIVKHGVGGPPEHRADDADYEVAAEWLGRAADRAAEHGRQVGLEIHAGTLTESAEGTAKLIDMTDRENVVAIHDAGNMYIAESDFGARSVEVLGDRLAHLHVKDLAPVEDETLPGAFTTGTPSGERTFQHRHLGEGAVDHAELFAALAEMGFDGYATDECAVPQEGPDGDEQVARKEYDALSESLARARGN